MQKEDNILDELARDQNSGFKVPENYLESFEEHIMTQVKFHNKPASQQLFATLKPWLMMAAMFIGIAGTYITYSLTTSNSTIHSQYEDFEDMYSSLEYELHEDDILEYMMEEDIEIIASEDEIHIDLSDEEIEELLMY